MEKIEPEPRDSSFVNVNGIRLHTLDWGGDGAPIVILHATGFLGRIYRPLAERLRAIGHVYSYDQRGHGDSSAAPDGEYSWDATMRDLEGFITAMGWSGVRAVGHSAGATAIGSLACERPDLISRAVLARAGDLRVAGRAGTRMAQSVYRADAEAQAHFRQRRGDVLELREQAAVQHLAQGHSARLLRVRHASDAATASANSSARPRSRQNSTRRRATSTGSGEFSAARRRCW